MTRRSVPNPRRGVAPLEERKRGWPNDKTALLTICSPKERPLARNLLSLPPNYTPSPETDTLLLKFLISATINGKYALVSRLLPMLSTKPYLFPHNLISKAISAGLEMYKLYYQANPAILSYLVPGHGEDVICIALKEGQYDIVQFALEHGADPGRNADSPRVYNCYLPIEYCAVYTCVPLSQLELLLRYGAMVGGTCALQSAAEFGKLGFVKALMGAGADVEEVIMQRMGRGVGRGVGFTALEGAVRNRRVEVVRYLLEMGGDPGARDAQGRTLVEIARESGNEDVLKLLSEASE